MLNDTSRWSHTPVNRVVPYHWQATASRTATPISLTIVSIAFSFHWAYRYDETNANTGQELSRGKDSCT